MKKVSVLILVLLAGLLSLSLFKKEALPPAWIPFNLSMMKANPSFLNCYAKAEGRKWKWLKSLYEKGLTQPPTAYIPKIIHQIWLGSPLPAKYKRWQETWQKKHPDWHYKLWTDLDLVDFPFTDRSRFERAVDIREKADILRYDILLHFGGLYVDIDFECLKSFEPIHATCDFYTGLQASLPHQNEPLMGNAVIGSIPNHPILRYCLQEISKKAPGTTTEEIQSISGKVCLRKAFFKMGKEGNLRNIAFPFTYFYPLLPEQCEDLSHAKWIEPESYGIQHHDMGIDEVNQIAISSLAAEHRPGSLA